MIEPDKPLGKTYAAALAQAGFSVRIAGDVQAAIHEVDKKIPAVIVLELQLATHNGIEFLYELRSYPEWQGIPVIILSQVSETEAGIDKKMAQKLGIRRYCYKPRTNLKKLIEVLKTEVMPA